MRRWTHDRELFFPNATLQLRGHAYHSGSTVLDVLASPQSWAACALADAAPDHDGNPIVPLPYLVLMKLDSARGVDQGDLQRMLGALSDQDVERDIATVRTHYADAAAAEDIRQ